MKILSRTKLSLLADSMTPEALAVIRSYANGKGGSFSKDAVSEVVSLGLIENVVNLLNNKRVWVFTANGKKFAKTLAERSLPSPRRDADFTRSPLARQIVEASRASERKQGVSEDPGPQ